MSLIRTAESLCPQCLKALPAEIVRRGDEVFLCRRCPEHGLFEEIIWRGRPDFEAWRRPKLPAAGLKVHHASEKGCPHDCGLCPEHTQHPCTVLFEITSRCNLRCPICFADSGRDEDFAPLEVLKAQLAYIQSQAGEIVLQISGGEPTLYPELPALTAEAARLFPGVQLNTNGLKLADDFQLAGQLAEAGLSWVFLQFDGVSDDTYKIIRGRPLLEIKKRAIAACAAAGLPVVLVPTVAAGVNDRELGGLVRFAVAGGPTVRGVHFQPMTSSGRNSLPGAAHRLTLPEVLVKLEEQTGGLVKVEQAFPPSCEHERCSFHLRYRRTETGELIPTSASGGCCGKTTSEAIPGREAAANTARSVDITLRSWGGRAPREPQGLPMFSPNNKPDAFDEFLTQARRETFSLTCMAFQDAWTADLARLRGCCVHVFRPPDQFIPFCAMNLTSADGRPLYR